MQMMLVQTFSTIIQRHCYDKVWLHISYSSKRTYENQTNDHKGGFIDEELILVSWLEKCQTIIELKYIVFVVESVFFRQHWYFWVTESGNSPTNLLLYYIKNIPLSLLCQIKTQKTTKTIEAIRTAVKNPEINPTPMETEPVK